MSKTFKRILSWILRGIAAAIMLQTLFFKFTAAPESIYIFSQLGIEPWGRIGTGVMELIASVLILFPKTKLTGAILGIFIMFGAILSHIFILGIEVKEDGGQLFIYALLVLFSCLFLLWIHRHELMRIFKHRFDQFHTTTS
jgi:hypothetical protein